ncbi:MAG: hypothetical protein CMQ49_10085 [Gammaproteobacteria bacterium]|nr:hypothetical protein [Gammaproteobacteria bacterium]|tara:strand:+ start:350 stop:757 length:408 start_codon:yes stop_codon:yes gene_type:complete
MDKVIFGSADWIERARAELEDLVATHGKPGERFSLCEIFTDTPTSVDPSGTLAWHFYIDGRSVAVDVGEIDDADVKISTDYQGVLPQARLVYTPEYLAERAEQPPGAQFDHAEGDFSLTPDYITELHNRLAVITA